MPLISGHPVGSGSLEQASYLLTGLMDGLCLPRTTRARIKKIADRMGYRPDPLLQALVAYRGKTTPRRNPPTLAYVTNWDTETVSQYTIGTDGTLAPLNPATVAVQAGRPSFVTVDPSGKYVYVANYNDDSVSQYTIGTNGTLASMNPATVETGVSPVSVITVSRHQ